MARRFLSLFLFFSSGLIALAQDRPLPLDPLTPREVASAGDIAMKDQRVIAFAGEQPRVIYVHFISPKQSREDGEPTGRFAEVVVHNDRESGGARVLVDLGRGAVVDATRLTERNVPIGPSDIEMAATLARESSAVQRILGSADAARKFQVARRGVARNLREDAIEGVADRGVDPDDPCTTHRCVTLFFRSGGQYIAINQVTVDLTARRVYTRGEGGRQ
ncbi:MAG TPA: hypothetical protein VF787_12980 [Thermoanaerobaculia bacterium]